MKSTAIMKSNPKRSYLLAGAAAGGAAAVLVGVFCTLGSRPALATVQFAKDTGKSCGTCHTAPAGGGPLTPYGDKFHANGDKMPKGV